ncbi:MAG TPA: radical SAM protein, partial [Calditrichia bacterium]|nr:radical SAM protein [Calditrichia bacterium]
MNDDQSRVHVDPATTRKDSVKTEVGSVFVSNYPPYSFWNSQDVEKALEAFGQPASQSPLGFYLHIPFCRKRCKFCYFKVYTGKNSSEIQSYLDGLAAEFETYARQPAVLGRPLKFIYFGGGTPSFISVKHLQWLTERLKDNFDTRTVSEFAFECEPGTLTASKLEAIREVGVSRLSLGVEHFDDRILADNGRAHTSTEIYRVWPWIKEMDFEQVNIDLIAGMVGESESSWMAAVEKAIELEPDSVTIYQLELPYNAIYSQSIRDGNPEHLV